MVDSSDTGSGSPTVEDGYGWLTTRASNALTRLQAIEVSDTSVIIADDLYFHPIYPTFQQGVVQCLLSALDHLRFLAWSLENRDIRILRSGHTDTNRNHRSIDSFMDGQREHSHRTSFAGIGIQLQ